MAGDAQERPAPGDGRQETSQQGADCGGRDAGLGWRLACGEGTRRSGGGGGGMAGAARSLGFRVEICPQSSGQNHIQKS